MDMLMEPKKKRKSVAAQAAAQEPLPKLPDEMFDKLVTGPMTPSEVKGLMLAFNKALIERAMGAEMNHHLGYKPGEDKPGGQGNERNGASAKTVLTEHGSVRIKVPRDRDGSFEPILIPKHERRFTGFDDQIIAMYARGMSVREIQGFIADTYGTDVSPDFISSVTDEVMAEALSWQSRPLERMYPVVFFDALRVKIRTDGLVVNKAVYLALGIQPDGKRDVLGLWIEQTEGAKFWLKVFNDLKNRGCQDILIAVVDGLKGLAEAITTVYPKTTVQTCIVHLIRNSMDYASWKERKALAQALKPIYSAASEEAALAALAAFEEGPWGKRYPPVVQAWKRAWEHVTPFFAFPNDIRRVIYTTNAIESMNMQLRKIIKTRGHFPNDDAAVKLLWLALRNALNKTVRSAFDWKAAMNQFAILFGERFTEARRLDVLPTALPTKTLTGPFIMTLMLGIVSPLAFAYPDKPIRIVVPYTAGGGTDITARLFGNELATAFKQTVIVENKPGGNTIIGMQAIARAEPDGYTIGLVSGIRRAGKIARRRKEICS